jgi:hypothetical protein
MIGLDGRIAMDQTRFDGISKLFAQRRLSRRRAVQQGAAGLVASGLAVAGLKVAAAQDATPATGASPAAGEGAANVEFLFLQSFESGTIATKTGRDGTYTLTLQHGLGQTLYFSDRPERIVGAAPTARFLAGLGFTPHNPPNAALLVDSGDGGVDIAVVELTNPSYDEASFTATYDATVLRDYEREVDLKFQEAPTDLAALAPSFGSAHLFIDDCPDITTCEGIQVDAPIPGGPVGTCWHWDTWTCDPCDGRSQEDLDQLCNRTYPACNHACDAG